MKHALTQQVMDELVKEMIRDYIKGIAKKKMVLNMANRLEDYGVPLLNGVDLADRAYRTMTSLKDGFTLNQYYQAFAQQNLK